MVGGVRKTHTLLLPPSIRAFRPGEQWEVTQVVPETVIVSSPVSEMIRQLVNCFCDVFQFFKRAEIIIFAVGLVTIPAAPAAEGDPVRRPRRLAGRGLNWLTRR